MNKSMLQTRRFLVVVVAAYVGILLWSHLAVIAPRFAYRGFEFNPLSAGMLSLAVVLALIPTFWMPLTSQRPSALTYFILYFLLYIPACIVPVCTLDHEPQRYLPYLFCIAVCFWGLGHIYRLELPRLSHRKMPRGLFWAVLVLTSCLINVLIIKTFGLHLKMPSLRGEIYQLRYEFRDVLAGTNSAYLIMLQSKVLAPLFVVWGLHKRNLGLLAFGFCTQLLIFMNAGVKTVLFSSVFIVGLYFALQISHRKLFLSMATALVAVVVTARIADKLWDEDEIYFSSIFVRRLILTPGLLSGYYVDFFSNNPKAMYGHSVLSGVVDYPYSQTPSQLISNTYFGTERGRSNANFWADGYANLGLPGVALATLLLASVLWCYDSMAVGVDRRVSTLMLAMPSMALVNSALLTVLVSHGLLLAMLLVYVMPRTTESSAAQHKRLVPRNRISPSHPTTCAPS